MRTAQCRSRDAFRRDAGSRERNADATVAASLDLQHPQDDARAISCRGARVSMARWRSASRGARASAPKSSRRRRATTTRQTGSGCPATASSTSLPSGLGTRHAVRARRQRVRQDYQLAADYATGGPTCSRGLRWQPMRRPPTSPSAARRWPPGACRRGGRIAGVRRSTTGRDGHPAGAGAADREPGAARHRAAVCRRRGGRVVGVIATSDWPPEARALRGSATARARSRANRRAGAGPRRDLALHGAGQVDALRAPASPCS